MQYSGTMHTHNIHTVIHSHIKVLMNINITIHSATGDMIVTQGASVPDSLSNVTGTMNKKFNRTTQAFVPGSARDIVFKAIYMAW